MKCKSCNVEFEAKRASAKYCSDKCKLDFNRGRDTVSVSKKDTLSVSKDKVSVSSERVSVSKDTVSVSNPEVSVSNPEVSVSKILSVSSEPLSVSTNPASLEHYQNNPDKYITRQEPERLNWGRWMGVHELEANKLKANRVSIPGDWDYLAV